MKEITVRDLKKMWITFFENHNHNQIKGSSLVPETDNSVLFTTAGMQPLIPFLLGKPHPQGKRLYNVQRCLRTNDIESVGDENHFTFFEMLGNWSLGDYFKEEAIKNSFEFLTSKDYLNLPLNKLAVTVFAGDNVAPRDDESALIWEKCGMPKNQIFYLGKEHNWWSAGETGPCGTDTEMFFITDKEKCCENCSPACDCGHYVEIGNDVFMQYVVKEAGEKAELLNQKNVDTGMGLERTVAALNGYSSAYQIDVMRDAIKVLESISINKYEESLECTKAFRIVVDHIRATTFILGDENRITPSNVGQGYVLRRLIRRAVTYAKKIGTDLTKIDTLVNYYINYYAEDVAILEKNRTIIIEELNKEISKFNKTISSGLKEFKQAVNKCENGILNGNIAFRLHDTFGFPIELTREMCGELNIKVDMEGYKQAFEHHQNLSRANSDKTFKCGLAGTSDIEIKYHTLTHLCLAGLRQIFGENTFQRGSNITAERMRFDFNLDRKMTDEEKQTLTNIVNEKIKENLNVVKEEMTVKEAKEQGALGVFEDRYGDVVSVYTIGNFSKEICGGPHVKNTGELGEFVLLKEESSSSGVRRIKGILK